MSDRNVEAAPNIEFAPAPSGGEQLPDQAPEQSAPKETSGNRPAAATAPVMPVPAAPAAPVAATPDEPTNVVVTSAPSDDDLAAADADLIEKEWVHKAKAIVSKTQDDPYKQKSEMSKVKAEYIQKRFNKTVKTDEAAPA